MKPIPGKAGIAAAAGEAPDLVVCDIMMPGTDGFGVLEALRKQRDTSLTPFIFLTAKAGGQDVRRKGWARARMITLLNHSTPMRLIASARQRLARRRLQIEEAERRAADTGMLAAAALPREMEGCLAHIETISDVFAASTPATRQAGEMRGRMREEFARLRHLSQRLQLYGELPSLYAPAILDRNGAPAVACSPRVAGKPRRSVASAVDPDCGPGDSTP